MTNTVDSLRERVAELERALACERGEVWAAPDGWTWKHDAMFGNRWTRDALDRVYQPDNGNGPRWILWMRSTDGTRTSHDTALDAMRYCDAVRAGGGK